MKPLYWFLVAIAIASMIFTVVHTLHAGTQYVSGKYGGKCYPKGFEDSRIRYKMYFDSLELCQKYTDD